MGIAPDRVSRGTAGGIPRRDRKARCDDLRDDRAGEDARGLQFLFGSFRGSLLRSVEKENRGAILRPVIRPLAVEGRGIVTLPERIEELCIRNLRGIELHAHRFRMTGASGADLRVGGIRDGSARVADCGADDAGERAKIGFDAPETPRGEDCALGWGSRVHGKRLREDGRAGDAYQKDREFGEAEPDGAHGWLIEATRGECGCQKSALSARATALPRQSFIEIPPRKLPRR